MFIPLNQILRAILDFGLRIADLLYRFTITSQRSITVIFMPI